MKDKKPKKPHRKFWIFFRIQLVLLILVGLGAGWYFFGGYYTQIRDLKAEAEAIAKKSSESDFLSEQTSIVYAADGSEISKLKKSRDSYYLTSDEIPFNVKAAIVSIEDKKFYEHKGVDNKAILRAFLAMVKNGEATQGGSTITQQLARNIYLSMEKTWQRKVEEIYLAKALEKKYSKDQILEFYLNNIYFANGYYGIEAASQGYFSKPASRLSLSETAFLLAIPNNPSYYDPLTAKDHTIERRDRILESMLKDQIISQASYHMALAEQITLHPSTSSKNVYVETYAYYCATRALMEMRGFVFRYARSMTEETREEYEQAYYDMYDVCQRDLYTGGYRVYTTLDLQIQNELQACVDRGLADFEEVNEEGVYALQSSGCCIDNDNGFVVAIVGGRSQPLPGYTLNRAYQSFRQPGSSIKPLIVYTPAIERGYMPDSVVVDQKTEDGPSNSGDGYAGAISLRDAVAYSKNTVAHQLFMEMTPEICLDYLDDLEFTHIRSSDVRPAAALGGFTNGASAVEMTSAFATLENDGIFRTPTCILRIEDADGNVLYAPDRTGKPVYKENAARIMTDLLTSVMDYGTGRKISLEEMPSAGKTGTTNDNKDGWFVGYTRYYTTGIWVGYDLPRTMEDLQGATYPGRIWQDFMQNLHTGKAPLEFLPYSDYTNTEGETESETEPAIENAPEPEPPAEESPIETAPPEETPPAPEAPPEEAPAEPLPQIPPETPLPEA